MNKVTRIVEAVLIRRVAIPVAPGGFHVGQPRTEHSRDWHDDLFGEQKSFVADPAKRKAAVTSRRAGKTVGDAYWLYEGGCDAPGGVSAFITTSVGHSERSMGLALAGIARRHPEFGLYRHHVEGDLVWELPNKHRIWLAGCKNHSEIEKFRGVTTGYRRVVVDEAGSFGAWLEELVEDVLEPGLADYDGELALTGTPPAVPDGYFFDVTTGNKREAWPTYHWTLRDNPYMRHVQAFLARVLRDNGWTEEHPRFQREYLGKWVVDLGALVFPFDPDRNGFYDLPVAPSGREYRHATGMDLGYIDACAWVAGSWVPDLPTLWLEESTSESGLIPSRFAVETEKWRQRWPGRLIGDTGGIGKAYIEEAVRSYGLPIASAQKHDKVVAIEYMRGDIMAGTLKAHRTRCSSLFDEAKRIQWNEQHTDIDKRCVDHETHAALYLHRDVRLRYRPQEEDPTPGSPEAAKAEMVRLREKRAKELRQARRKSDERWRA